MDQIFFVFFFFCVPKLYLWDSTFWVRFLRMWPFFKQTIEVVTFHLHGWCMLGVFLLPAFTRLGHECQDLLSPCDRMHVRTDWTSVYTLICKGSWGMESEPMLTPREIFPLLKKFFSEEDWTHDAASSRTASPTHYQQAILAQQMDQTLSLTPWDKSRITCLIIPHCSFCGYWLDLHRSTQQFTPLYSEAWDKPLCFNPLNISKDNNLSHF